VKKIFILGVGCQKGGTTWLYQYLNANPAVDIGFAKEYHVFDAIYVDECRRFLDDALLRLKQAVNTDGIMASHPNILKIIDFYRSTENYFEYFDYLHYKSDQTIAVGDITPSYSALPVEAFEHIKVGLEARGFKIKVIFLMRDPFDRIWSHVRMVRKRKLKGYPSFQHDPAEGEAMLSVYRTIPFQIRTRYEKTISNLESVFEIDDIHYEFYENLFKVDSIKKLTSFLTIPYQDPNLETIVNDSPNNETMISDNIVFEIVNFYRDTYLFNINKFGQEKVNMMWKSAKHLNLTIPST